MKQNEIDSFYFSICIVVLQYFMRVLLSLSLSLSPCVFLLLRHNIRCRANNDLTVNIAKWQPVIVQPLLDSSENN